jgi:hypothetical protein
MHMNVLRTNATGLVSVPPTLLVVLDRDFAIAWSAAIWRKSKGIKCQLQIF